MEELIHNIEEELEAQKLEDIKINVTREFWVKEKDEKSLKQLKYHFKSMDYSVYISKIDTCEFNDGWEYKYKICVSEYNGTVKVDYDRVYISYARVVIIPESLKDDIVIKYVNDDKLNSIFNN